MNLEALSPPAPDELEVTVLGRGYGESVIVHMGDNNWIVVDSIAFSKVNGPLDYLSRLGVEPSAIRVILATHWHDDHVKGIAQIYAAAVNANLFFSIALREKEFAAFVEDQGAEPLANFSSGVQELLLAEKIRKEQGREKFVLVAASQTLFVRHASQTSFHLPSEFKALSPSSSDVSDFVKALVVDPAPGAARLPELKNPACVVGWCYAGKRAALLGADLENSRERESGWQAILDSDKLPEGLAEVFKVPHHGSENAHHPDVWKRLLARETLAALAPWKRGAKALPKDSDVSRLKAHASRLFTARVQTGTAYRDGPSVIDKLLRDSDAKMTTLPSRYGYVQMRCKITDTEPWSVTLGGGAAEL